MNTLLKRKPPIPVGRELIIDWVLNEWKLRLLPKHLSFCGSSRVYFYGIDQVTSKHIIHENDNQMNTKLNLIEKLKNVPEGTMLYSPLFGDVEFIKVFNGRRHAIQVNYSDSDTSFFTTEGKYFDDAPDSECLLFPSRDQRDWSKFEYDPIAIGTPVMVKGPGNWILRFYAGQGECCKHQGYFSEALIKLGTFKGEEIIPVSEFDFENLCRMREAK